MNMESLEFIIYPDGRVQETVTGIIGTSCQEVTKAIEAELGQVVSQEKTGDYYAQEIYQNHQVTNQATFSQW